jgi:ABC-type tungstate transport system permease subunit
MDATFNQRRALFNMHTYLGWDCKGIRDMTFEEASAAIDKAKAEFVKRGFETNSNEEEL